MHSNKELVTRKAIIQYMAFVRELSYYKVSDFTQSMKYKIKDMTECSNHYIRKGWMTGTPLSSSNRYSTSLFFVGNYRCKVIACTSLEDVSCIKSNNKLSSFWQRDIEESFNTFVYALNAYARSLPELVSAMKKDVDYDVEMPSKEEQVKAQKLWLKAKKTLCEDLEEFQDYELLSSLIAYPGMSEFINALPEELIRYSFDFIACDFERAKIVNDDDYATAKSIADDAADILGDAYPHVVDKLTFYYQFMYDGDIEKYLSILHKGSFFHETLSAMNLMQNGMFDEAFDRLYKLLKCGDAYFFGTDYLNYLYGLCALQAKSPSVVKKVEALVKKKLFKEDDTIPVLKFLLQQKLHPETDFDKWIVNNADQHNVSNLEHALFAALCKHFGIDNPRKGDEIYMSMFIPKVLMLDLIPNMPNSSIKIEQVEADTKMHTFLPNVHAKESWEKIIDAIMIKCTPTKGANKKGTSEEISRVVYELDPQNYSVQPKLQKSKNGGNTWSSGRNIALTKFMNGIPEMTTQDYKVASTVSQYTYGWYGTSNYTLGGLDTLVALVGHPNVYNAQNTDVRIDVTEEKLQVEIKETRAGFMVNHNAWKQNGDYQTCSAKVVSNQCINVMNMSQEEVDILRLISSVRLFPLAAKGQLTVMLDSLSKKLTVVSSLMKNVDSVISKKGDSTITVQLVPIDDNIHAKCFVKPIPGCAPCCNPGKGLEYVASTIKGKNVQIERNLKEEVKNLKKLKEWLAPLDEYAEEDGWVLPMVACLETLDILREHQSEVHVEWPEGVKFKVVRPMIGASNLSVSVKGVGHWFQVDGNVKIDEKTTLKIAELLMKVRESKGNFIELGDNEYIAISQQLKKHLTALERIVQTEHKQMKVAQYNTSFLQELESLGIDFKADKEYTSLVKNLEEADTMKVNVPKGLQADLRDYQKDGFRWLSRLAHWGAGACLADDMGLGKTIQTIALLLSHASEGASLVVMPTSVLLNWRDELARFAPTLNVVILRNSVNRKEAVDNAGAYSVVLATYGLMPTEEDILVGKKWNVVVLDEAHNIKNKETKTSKVVMQIDAKFRLLLTGTPLQNHLSEIWNLFQFATPGLLPSYTQFTQKFINPIERDMDKERQRLLKRILMPFILRRTKSDVLNELPKKTEITMKVELSPEERALYDQFRQDAVLNLEEGNATPIQALAELTKLRQTACNAALVLPKKEAKSIPSAKMEAFLKLVDELIQNHHRALVFSQFTSHLAIVKEQLDALGIDYKYLDGGTSPTERTERVKSFQEGDMPLFLISLKAGGVGLNLTAADFVIHLDPWWNPAIEDQASDRAYRIGQNKPVTVYRLIATNTIEEKIIELHQTKKSLADALLEGSDMNHALGKDEILALLKESI